MMARRRDQGGALQAIALGLGGSVAGAVVGYGGPAFVERTVTHQGMGGLVSWAWLVAVLTPVLSGLLAGVLLARFGSGGAVSPVLAGVLSVVGPAAWVTRTVVVALTMGAPVGLLLMTTIPGLALGAVTGAVVFRTASRAPGRRRFL